VAGREPASTRGSTVVACDGATPPLNLCDNWAT